MNKLFNFLSLTPFIILISFIQFGPKKEHAHLEGYWVYDSNNKELQIYDRKEGFQKDQPGIAFLKNGKLLKRQNAGWCGTPPIAYRNFDGTWKWDGEQSVRVVYEFWGGTIEETWEIHSLNKNELTLVSKEFEIIKDKRSH